MDNRAIHDHEGTDDVHEKAPKQSPPVQSAASANNVLLWGIGITGGLIAFAAGLIAGQSVGQAFFLFIIAVWPSCVLGAIVCAHWDASKRRPDPRDKKWSRGDATFALAATILIPAGLLLYVWWQGRGDWGPVIFYGIFYAALFVPVAWFFFKRAIGIPPESPEEPDQTSRF